MVAVFSAPEGASLAIIGHHAGMSLEPAMVIAGMLAEVAEDERCGRPGAETEGGMFLFNTNVFANGVFVPQIAVRHMLDGCPYIVHSI